MGVADLQPMPMLHRLLIAATGALAGGTVLLRLVSAMSTAAHPLDGFILVFSFFTNWSNAAVALICLYVAAGGRWTRARIDLISAVTVMIVLVGLAYHLLLNGAIQFDSLNYRIETILHYIVPTAVLGLWIWCVPKGHLSLLRPFVWLCFPAIYLVMALIGAMLSERSPYYFLDIMRAGIGGVLPYIGVLLLTILSVAYCLIAADRILAKRAELSSHPTTN
ncbi:Pr6Pr family membrane protein [Halovulum sp. GXIMD14793]